jgi:hypothetical protein
MSGPGGAGGLLELRAPRSTCLRVPTRRLEVVVDLALHVDRDAAQVAGLERRNADDHLRGLLIYGRVSALAQVVCQT